MRGITRVCWRAYESDGSLALVAVAFVAWFFMHVEAGFVAHTAFTVRPGDHLLNYWLLLVLGAAYCVWAVLRVRALIDPAGGMGFVLAAAGVFARYFRNFVAYGMSETYGGHSVLEETASDSLRMLLGALRHGGLVAFVVGLAVVALGSRRPPTLLRDRGRSRRA